MVKSRRRVTSAAAGHQHFTMAAAVPTLADIFATAFSSIGKVVLAVEAAHVADHDVWIADARGLDDMLLKHRKPREQGAEDTSWDMLFATLVGKGIITILQN